MDRHARSELILGKKGHRRLRDSVVTIAGIGAVGTIVGEILGRQGVGTLIGIDPDKKVEEHNLDRQFLYRQSHVNKPKALAFEEALSEVNSDVHVISYVGDFEEAIRSSCERAVRSSDVLISAVDNGLARYSVSKYSLIYDIAHLDGATGGFNCRAYVMPHPHEGPCVICTFTRQDYEEISKPFSCTRRDRSRPAPAITETGAQIGTVLATETLKLLLDYPIEYNEIRINMREWQIAIEKTDPQPSHSDAHAWLG